MRVALLLLHIHFSLCLFHSVFSMYVTFSIFLFIYLCQYKAKRIFGLPSCPFFLQPPISIPLFILTSSISIHPSICLAMSLSSSIYLSIFLFTYSSLCLSILLLTHLPVYQSLSISLSAPAAVVRQHLITDQTLHSSAHPTTFYFQPPSVPFYLSLPHASHT